MNNYFTVKELPESERPYEKLEKKGSSSLTDAELLAIIIKTGSKNERCTELATKILASSENGLLSLHDLTISELMEFSGIGKVKAIQLKAAAEISKRMYKKSYERSVNLTSPKSIAMMYMEEFRHLKKEKIIMLNLNAKNQIISEVVLSVGTVNSSLINPREVFRMALKNNAVSIVLLHNHPSGNPTPSKEDLMITRDMVKASELIGIKLLDHLLIGDGKYTSLREEMIL